MSGDTYEFPGPDEEPTLMQPPPAQEIGELGWARVLNTRLNDFAKSTPEQLLERHKEECAKRAKN
ncbi:MAG: hypothetical protein GWN93_06000 [Deltaproteobacteria bacterium]|nr:hypothetical protein [Deltaproteobacteria bacterium]